LEGWFVEASEKVDPPLHRRASFEVTGWDGLRWVLEGVFDTGAEAAAEAKHVLARRLGVKLTEETLDADGIFKSRVIHSEYRDGVKPERKPPPESSVAKPPLLGKRPLARTDAVLYVAISSLVISIAAMFFSILR
jgi:hypothetical protein